MHFDLGDKATGNDADKIRERLIEYVMDLGPAVIYITDLDGRFIAVNKKFASLFNRTQEQIVGLKREEFMPPDIAAQHRANDLRVIEAKEAISFGEDNDEPDGIHHYMTNKVPLRDDEGNIVGVAGISLDITEQKRVEEELSLERDFLGAIFNSVPGMLYLYDTEGNLVRWNHRHESMTGYTSEELSRMTLGKWYEGDPESLEAVQKGLARTMTDGFGDAEANLRTKNGELIPMYFTACPLTIRGKQYFTGIGIDVTERKRAERKLRESEERFENLFERAPLGYQSLDGEGRFIEVNEAWLSTLGYARDEVIGKWFGDFLAPECVDAFRERFPAFKAAGKTRTEFEMIHKSGERKAIAFEGRIGYAKDGSFEKTHCILQDITERKKIETEKQRLQEQLLQSQKMESVGRLAGGIAHDFNNMLGVIIGYADLAMGKVAPSAPVFGDLQEIASAARRSAELTRQLLAFARKQTIAPETLDLNETIGGMLKMLRYIIGENIALEWHPGSGIERVKMDPTQLNQILANLCVNARDAIPGEGRITIETGKVSFGEDYCSSHADFLPGEFIMLAVSDDGCGMSKETMGKIFEPFFTTKEMGRGTGLGLSTVYGIVRQNGGFINVYSEIDNGTTFKIYIPPFKGESSGEEEKIEAPAQEPKTETILLVEDELPLLTMTKTMLERIGYRVLSASGGMEALDAAADFTGHIDLLITDVIMPGMNGRELADRLGQLYPGVEKLYMSGYTATFIAGKGVLDEGMNFIQKPFTAEDLALKVRESLGGKQG